MAGGPQRFERWSLLQVAADAGVSRAAARAAVAAGHLDVDVLRADDALVLRVAALTPSFQTVGETRAANEPRIPAAREVEAVSLTRQHGLRMPAEATLLVTSARATLVKTADAAAAQASKHVAAGTQFLSLPVGAWAEQLRSAGRVAS